MKQSSSPHSVRTCNWTERAGNIDNGRIKKRALCIRVCFLHLQHIYCRTCRWRQFSHFWFCLNVANVLRNWWKRLVCLLVFCLISRVRLRFTETRHTEHLSQSEGGNYTMFQKKFSCFPLGLQLFSHSSRHFITANLLTGAISLRIQKNSDPQSDILGYDKSIMAWIWIS